MNTITCQPCAPLPAPQAGPTRALGALAQRLAAWWQRRREAALARAHWRALQALDDRTRRDLGLAEASPAYDPTQLAIDIERCRW